MLNITLCTVQRENTFEGSTFDTGRNDCKVTERSNGYLIQYVNSTGVTERRSSLQYSAWPRIINDEKIEIHVYKKQKHWHRIHNSYSTYSTILHDSCAQRKKKSIFTIHYLHLFKAYILSSKQNKPGQLFTHSNIYMKRFWKMFLSKVTQTVFDTSLCVTWESIRDL